MAVLDFLKEHTKEKKQLTVKPKLDEDIITAMEYIIQNSGASMEVLVEAAIARQNYIKIAADLKKEIETQNQ